MQRGFSEKIFAEQILLRIAEGTRVKRRKGSAGGEAARAHDESEAARLVGAALLHLGLPEDPAQLTGRGKWLDEKALVVALVRKRTGVRNRWIADRLGMTSEGSVPKIGH